MTTKTITGKVRIIPAGHKNKTDNKPTWYRDGDGNYHAEFYKASVGQVESDGKYHSYTFNVDASEAEAFGNMKIGTTFKVTVTPRMETKTDDNGAEIVTERIRLSEDHMSVYHDVHLEEIEVAKGGCIARPRVTQYFADVRWEDDKKTEDSGEVAE